MRVAERDVAVGVFQMVAEVDEGEEEGVEAGEGAPAFGIGEEAFVEAGEVGVEVEGLGVEAVEVRGGVRIAVAMRVRPLRRGAAR
ncbi:hypothetical protein ACFQ51_34870 [Streptomyces kaempferi]